MKAYENFWNPVTKQILTILVNMQTNTNNFFSIILMLLKLPSVLTQEQVDYVGTRSPRYYDNAAA